MPANGYFTDADLAPIDNGQRLAPAAATRYMAMRALAASQGVNIRTTEGYRDYARQVYYRNLYLSGRGNPAGIPGTSSHGWGLAVDLNTTGFGGTVFNWLTANAAQFGFNNRQGRADGEHWHWVYDGTGTAGLDIRPITTEKDEDMRLIYEKPKPTAPNEGVYWLLQGNTLAPFNGTQTQANELVPILGKTLTPAMLGFSSFDAFKSAFVAGAGVVPAIDYAKLAALIPKPPTAVEIATAVNTDAAKRLSA